jgi:hypothetical protein
MENGTWFQKMDKGGILREWGDYGACNYTRHPNHIIDNGATAFGNLTERDLRLMASTCCFHFASSTLLLPLCLLPLCLLPLCLLQKKAKIKFEK